MRARLTVETGAATPPVFDFSDGQTVRLGRDPQSTLVLGDRFASRKHAEVYPTEGGWKIRDLQSTNKTRVNGEPIRQSARLADGDLIAIGDVRLRFNLNPGRDSTAEIPVFIPNEQPAAAVGLPAPGEGELSHTDLQADELTALVVFLKDSQRESTVHGLVALALTVAHRQTQATLAGYLSLDPEDPRLKLVHPDRAAVDVPLSRRLTQAVLQTRRPVWLSAARTPDLEGDSLLAFRDALCLPLRSAEAAAGENPLGALHVYKANRPFTDREVRFCEVLAGCLAGALHVLRGRCVLEGDVRRLRGHAAGDDLVGDSPALTQLRQQIDRLADLPCTVLISGESGVGKELVAVGLHQRSRRRDGPFVPLNCAALPASLIEAELFGHKKGAFSDATADRPGCFLTADEGTLFLDEIGEMPLESQARLLRVLETKRVKAVGDDKERAVDVRIVAATNRDLSQAVRDGRFRQDLFYRLAPVLPVPPLRDHAEDIPALTEHLLTRLAAEYHRRVTLSEAALQRLRAYRWPGNVRQMRTVLESAVALCDDRGVVHAGDLRLPDEPGAAPGPVESLNLEALEAWAIRQALARTGGNATQAAQLLGIHRDTLQAKLKKYGIERRAEGK
jgi:Nif-specific regulatory protein